MARGMRAPFFLGWSKAREVLGFGLLWWFSF